jgi:hypothetical protein
MDPKSITLPLGYIPFAPNNGIEPLAKRFSVFRSTTELVRRKIMKKFTNSVNALGFEPRTNGLKDRCSTAELCIQYILSLLSMGLEPILMPWKGIILTYRWTELLYIEP